MAARNPEDEALARQALTEALIAREAIKAVAEASTIREAMSTRSFTSLEARVEALPQLINALATTQKADIKAVWAFLEKIGFMLLGILIAGILNLAGIIFVMVTKT